MISKKRFPWLITYCSILFCFNFWLFYPGYFTYDWSRLLATFELNNWQPVIYPYLLQKITGIFGYHLYYPLIFNLLPFYLGFYFLVRGCWEKFHSFWCLLVFLPLLIQNIFFANAVAHCSFSSPMFIFLLWSILLYQLMTHITLTNMIMLSISFIFAVLSRHNALIQAYPIFFVYAWLIIQKSKKSYRFLKYIGFLLVFAVITIAISIGVPKLLKNTQSYPTNHIFLHQIAGACVPHHDKTCFKSEWYLPGQDFSDVEQAFYTAPLLADKMVEGPFSKKKNLKQLPQQWMRSICKYPIDYIKYINHYRKEMWHVYPMQFSFFNPRQNKYCTNEISCNYLKSKYPPEEIFYNSPKIKIYIYNFLEGALFIIPTFLFILLNFILLGITGPLFYRTKDIILLYSLSSCIAGIVASIIFCIFSPTPESRYIYPVLISTLMSCIGFVIYSILYFLKKRTQTRQN